MEYKETTDVMDELLSIGCDYSSYRQLLDQCEASPYIYLKIGNSGMNITPSDPKTQALHAGIVNLLQEQLLLNKEKFLTKVDKDLR